MTKPTWTDEEKFWRSIRQAALALVDAVETYKLAAHTKVRTAEIRKRLKSYQRPRIIAETAPECTVEFIIQEKTAGPQSSADELLTTRVECNEI